MKKDTNYVASVEKAISDKYGKEAVQDFRSEWSPEREKDYLNQLRQRQKGGRQRTKKEKIKMDEIEIIKRPSTQKSDRSCPICKTYSFSSRDDLYMNRFQCCFPCYIDFIEFREEEWENGWRPEAKDILHATGRRKKNV